MMTTSYNQKLQTFKEQLVNKTFNGELASGIYLRIDRKTDAIVTAVYVNLRTVHRNIFHHYSFDDCTGFL
jgi:hypothetical protein